MNALFFLSLSVLAWAAVCPVSAKEKAKAKVEEEEPPATLLFVNAVGDKGLGFFLIDGMDANPSGFQTGRATGWVQFPSGEREIEVEHQPLGKWVSKKELEPGSRQAYIAYHVLEDQSARGRPPRPTIGVYVLSCGGVNGKKIPTDKRRLVVLNTTMRDTVELEVGGEKVTAKRLKPVSVTADMGGGFIAVNPVAAESLDEVAKTDGQAEKEEAKTLATLNVEEPVVTYLIVHETVEGELRAVSFSEPAETKDTEVEEGN